jgi:hypothetical protein
MKPLSLLLISSVAVAACGGTNPIQPAIGAAVLEAPAFAKAAQPVYTCANADVVLGTLITFVRNATHVQAPATEAVLLPHLRAAHEALVATPCDTKGALDSMAAFTAAVNATAGTVSATQVIMFHSVANRVVASINLVR